MFVITTRSAIARYGHLRPQKDMKCKFWRILNGLIRSTLNAAAILFPAHPYI